MKKETIKKMIGQYTTNELTRMGNIISTVMDFDSGHCVRRCGKTINYYRQEPDGSWTNYDCKTKG